MVLALRRVYATTWLGAVLRMTVILFLYMVLVSALIEGTSSFQIISD